MAQQIADVFYNIVLPPLLVFLFGYWMWVLQRKSSSPTVNEFQMLLNEVQEERTELKVEIEKHKKESDALKQGIVECDQKIESYRNQVSTVMDSEKSKRMKLEERLDQVEKEKERIEAENQSLRSLVNALTSKLSLAEERLSVAQKQLDQMNLDIKHMKKQTGELK